MLMSERVVQKQRGVPGCISAALLFDSDFFFFFLLLIVITQFTESNIL